jgi:hypothetical protein
MDAAARSLSKVFLEDSQGNAQSKRKSVRKTYYLNFQSAHFGGNLQIKSTHPEDQKESHQQKKSVLIYWI